MATLRGARSHRHAMESERTRKRYWLGPESPMARCRSTSLTVALTTGASGRLSKRGAGTTVGPQLTADDVEFFRVLSMPDGGEPYA